jgi:hypothetical protein
MTLACSTQIGSLSRLAGCLFCTLLACTGGCATTGSVRRADALMTLFASDDAKRAQAAAPDLYARAERARRDARLAHGDDRAQAQHELRARLLLDAAVAEADRIASERGAAQAEARCAHAIEQRARLEQERLAIEQAATREQAAGKARAEAERAFQQGDLAESKRDEAPAEREGSRVKAAEALRGRALLMLAAASAIGLSSERSAEIERLIAGAADARGGAALLSAARSALSESERALGDARKALGAPTKEQTASLLEMGAERGLALRLVPGGVAIAIDGVFAAAGAEPTRAGRARLAQIAALARAHPSGAISIEALAAPTARTGAQQLARTRAQRIETELAKATDASRLQLARASVDDGGVERPRIVFTAYVLEPRPQ